MISMRLNSMCLLNALLFGSIIASSQRGYSLAESNPRKEKGHESGTRSLQHTDTSETRRAE